MERAKSINKMDFFFNYQKIWGKEDSILLIVTYGKESFVLIHNSQGNTFLFVFVFYNTKKQLSPVCVHTHTHAEAHIFINKKKHDSFHVKLKQLTTLEIWASKLKWRLISHTYNNAKNEVGPVKEHIFHAFKIKALMLISK